MKKKMLAFVCLTIAATAVQFGRLVSFADAAKSQRPAVEPAVTIHEASAEVEAGLNTFGAGVANWEEQYLGAFTYPDAHLYHRYAEIRNSSEKMNIKTGKLLDLHKIEIFGGTKNIDLYSFMRDRANIHNYVLMKKDGTVIAEDYWNATDKSTKNYLMSASKSFTAMVAAGTGSVE